MRSNNHKSIRKCAGIAASVLLLASGAAFAQQQVNLTAGPSTAALPDGSAVPMWGYTCGAAVAGSTATCAALNPTAAGAWSPVVITVPTGQDLAITLTNNLTFTPAGTGTTVNNIPTSLVIVGQLGGGLGTRTASCDSASLATTGATCTQSPDHTNAQPVTWPIAGTPPGAAPVGAAPAPTQGNRVQSFGTEVAAGAGATASNTATLCFGACSVPGQPALKPGTYLIESGTHPSIQGPMGLYGVLVVTAAPASGAAGCAYPGAAAGSCAVPYNAEIPLLLSEIDPVQNTAVNLAVNTNGFSETAVWSGQLNPTVALDSSGNPIPAPAQNAGCGSQVLANGQPNPAYGTCYPPAVNYTPLYYLINGLAFDKTNASKSLFAATPGTAAAPAAGTVLVRLVNAGLRMHVPSIVGAQTGASGAAGLSLIAEDGNVLPGVPRVQSEVFMPAGKTFDVAINVPAAPTTGTAQALPIFDRELSLSANAISRDTGMLAYISVNGAGLPATGSGGVLASPAAAAVNDSYTLVGTNPLVVSDPAKGLLANDTNVFGAQVIVGGAPGSVTGLTLNADGTFTYTGGATTFTYCGNGQTSGAACATVTLSACAGSCLEGAGGIVMNGTTYNANGTFLKIQPPGILAFDKDGAGYPLTVNGASVSGSGFATLSVDANGGFTASVTGCTPAAPATSCPLSFTYSAQNSQGTVSSNSATVTINFAPGSNLAVTVLDGKDVLAAQQGKIAPAAITKVTDYRWIIEEDRTFYVNPNCLTNPPPAGCPGATTAGLGTTGIVPTFGTNFHTSYMPLVAAGCTGTLSCEGGQTMFDPASGAHVNAVCDVGNGVCRPDTSSTTLGAGSGFAPHLPGEVHLDPTKRYYLTIFPGDAGNPFPAGNLSADCVNGVASAGTPSACGHGMSGTALAALTPINGNCTPVAPATTCFAPVTVLTEPDPYPPSKLSVFVFEDDFPLNGEQDGGGGIDVLSPNEPGLGGFNITLFDDAGGSGDATGQMTYDMFNQPLVNSLSGTIDPVTGLDACPVSKIARSGPQLDGNGNPIPGTLDNTQTGITGTIVTCPKFESDGRTLSPLAGQVVVANLMPGRYGVVATPGADRIGRGEEWLQTNTLDGQKAHDSFLRIGEPSSFQEYGPAGYHVAIGFANPAIINSRKAPLCSGTDANSPQPGTPYHCIHTVKGLVTTERMSRTPDERLYSSGSNQSFAFTQCYVSVGDADGEDFAFTKCAADGSFSLSGLPEGDWRVTVFDQWNDMLVDGLSTPVRLGNATSPTSPTTIDLGQVATGQWQANIYTRTFFDANGNGVSDKDIGGNDLETGLTLVATNIRFRDGSYSNFNNTDLNGYAGFNEVFPLFSWYVIETDTTRYASTGTHVVYDSGGPSDGTPGCGSTATPAPCGNSAIAGNLANTFEAVSVPTELRVPGSVYCADADCSTHPAGILGGPGSSDASNCTTTAGVTTCSAPTLSTGRIDPPWVWTEGWQGFSGQNQFIEFGKRPFVEANTPVPFGPNAGHTFSYAENGGIHGEVIYASTRPFDDPQLLIHTSWTPDVPGVTINLYQVSTGADGTQTLTLADTTKTSSWDDWAQGFYPGTNKPYMNCPGQSSADLFYFTLYNQPAYLDEYNNGGTPAHTMPSNAQFKCYDGMHNWNQVQPAPYDGMYQFPSIVNRDVTTGVPANVPNATAAGNMVGSNCTLCVANPVTGEPMLPKGQYVVEMIVPPGYELVKEEDKNILIGDNYIAPVTVQFPGLGAAIYIMPDQASVSSAYNANQGGLSAYNANNAQNPTQSFGRMSSLPSHEGDTGSVESFWPCVGQTRIVPDYISLFPQSLEVAPFAGAKRNLCDRKLVQLDDQTAALAKFWVFTSAHVAAHFTGVITDDYTSEFDPFSPQFGEKFSPPSLPVSIKDWTGQEISRVYADQWGTYNGLTYSTWEVNPPNPTGYAPTMMVTCMNDAGPIRDTRPTIVNAAGATVANPTLGQMITDPQFTAGYSQFCYEIPFMPGQTQYMDTPVVPTSAFAGAGYNNVDCAYPDSTPAIAEVDGDGVGPWVSGSGHTLTIHALGDQMVPNNAYSGPQATAAPYNQKMVKRHYGFGASQTGTGTNATNGSVTIGGVAATVGTWSDSLITVSVPSGVPDCLLQQQSIYGGSRAQCGELVVTSGSGQAGGNVTGVNITRGGRYTAAPTVTFGAAPAGGTTATGTANLGTVTHGVGSISVSNGGGGYTTTGATNPAVTLSAPPSGGTTATGTATVRKSVTAVTITNLATNSYPGTGAITVTFTVPTATGTVQATGTVITNGGAGTAASPRRVTGVTINNPGMYTRGQTITPTFSVPAAGGTRATGNTTAAGDTSGFVYAVTVNNAGSGYTTAPTVSIAAPPAANCPAGGPVTCINATATATLATAGTAAVVSVTLTNGGGSGYLTAPTVTFSPGVTGGTSTATGTATISGPAQTIAGRRSIDTVTVTIGGKAPVHVGATESIQSYIDKAAPGDLIIVDPTCTTNGTGAAAACNASSTQTASQVAHNELLLMWKPVRLQGVGAASSIINATTHPAGQIKLDAWRQQVNCLFGLGLSGSPITGSNPYDPAGQVTCPTTNSNRAGVTVTGTNGNNWAYFTALTDPNNPQVDRLPFESAVGWDANLNGNLAELLQEPSLMGALEGAGITVLAKGVNFPSNPYDPTLLAGFPAGTTLLQDTLSSETTGVGGAQCLDSTGAANPFPSNYSCNPSSVDGLTITQSSQGGGGIFVHAWGHNIQIANNRIYSNAGTLSGGINIGQGEYPPSYIQGSGTNAAPGSCEESPVAGVVLPYCHNVNVNVHNNYLSLNSSTGDELFSATPAGAGGVSICTGSDYYQFNYNWVCGNLSSGDGGGLGHLGFSYNGEIQHNTIIFNQSTNPTIPANGGGLIIMGTPDADPTCGATTDLDCVPDPASIGPSDGVGPGLVINANLIMGNGAESGSGGGIAFQAVNGSDIVAFPDDPGQWNEVTVTNNIIVDNVAGWDGAGVSLLDSPNVNIVNNTIAFNGSTASAGPLFNTIGAPLASTQGPTCTVNCGTTTHPQVGGVAVIQNSAVLTANLAGLPVVCPAGHFQGAGANAATNGACRSVSYPKLENNIIYHNASYYIGVGALSPQFQQNVVTLYNAFTTAQPANQTATGQCVAATSYWDLGVRGDTGPTSHASGFTLTASDSVFSVGNANVIGGGNSTLNPSFVSSYCDGARTPPEFKASGWQVPPGISDATVPNPVFNLTPSATVDEGNNWVNLRWGPLSMTNPAVTGGASGNYGGGLPLGNYSITAGSSAAGRVTAGGGGGATNRADAPAYDFFDNPRSGGSTDAGAVRLATGNGTGQFTLSAPLIDFGFVPHGAPTTVDQDIIVTNTDVVPLTVTNVVINCAGVTAGTCSNTSYSVVAQADSCSGFIGVGVTLGAGKSCMITVVFNPTSASQAVRNASLVVTAGGVSQTVALTGHDSIATFAAAPGTQTTPPLTATPANTAAVTGTITVTNTATRCDAPGACSAAGIPAGYPAANVDAGPIIPTSITLTPLTGTGTWALGGTCAVGTAINSGIAAIPANPAAGTAASPYVPSGSCTVTATYTPPAGATGAALNGTARVTMMGYGTAGAAQPATIINRVLNAN